MPQGRLEIWASGATETRASRPFEGQYGEALLRVAAQGLDMEAGDGFYHGATRGIDMAEFDKVVGQWAALVPSPGRESRKESALVDQPVLQGQQTEEQIARRVGPLPHVGDSQSIQNGTATTTSRPRRHDSIVGERRNQAQQSACWCGSTGRQAQCSPDSSLSSPSR